METAELSANSSKHPKAITHLFFTEMWERFSYYGVTTLLVLYLSNYLHLSDHNVYLIYGSYTAMVYMTAVFGGIISDKYIGPYNSVITGGLLLAFGHFILMLPATNLSILYTGLAFIILGTGLFKPSIATMVGALYTKNDHRRKNGFILAYMGANLGTVLAPITASIIAINYGWHIAFGIAGIGMLIGLINFTKSKKHYNLQNINLKRINNSIFPELSCTLCVIAIIYLFYHPQLVFNTLLIAIALSVVLLRQALLNCSTTQAQQLKVVLRLIFCYIIFMVSLQISGGLLNLFTDRFVNKQFFGYTIPTGIFQSIEPMALILFSIIFFISQKPNSKSVDYTVNFAYGLILMGCSFLILVLGIQLTKYQYNLNFWWLILTYTLQASGEIFIGPVGLAMLSERVPANNIGLFMGIWVLGSAIANYIAAYIGLFTEINYDPSMVLANVKSNYIIVFSSLGFTSLLVGIMILLIANKSIITANFLKLLRS